MSLKKHLPKVEKLKKELENTTVHFLDKGMKAKALVYLDSLITSLGGKVEKKVRKAQNHTFIKGQDFGTKEDAAEVKNTEVKKPVKKKRGRPKKSNDSDLMASNFNK